MRRLHDKRYKTENKWWKVKMNWREMEEETRHRCPVCLADGHHASTCSGVALPQNAERATQFLKRLHARNRLREYVSSVASKQPPAFAATVVRLVEEAIGADETRSIVKKNYKCT